MGCPARCDLITLKGEHTYTKQSQNFFVNFFSFPCQRKSNSNNQFCGVIKRLAIKSLVTFLSVGAPSSEVMMMNHQMLLMMMIMVRIFCIVGAICREVEIKIKVLSTSTMKHKGQPLSITCPESLESPFGGKRIWCQMIHIVNCLCLYQQMFNPKSERSWRRRCVKVLLPINLFYHSLTIVIKIRVHTCVFC